jgi:hypothetical protein
VIFWVIMPCTLVDGNPEDHNPHFHNCENLNLHLDEIKFNPEMKNPNYKLISLCDGYLNIL